MALSIWIKGVDKTSLLKAGSLTINRGADNRNDCSLSLITTAAAMGSTDGSYIGQDLQIKDGSAVLFGGVIKMLNMRKLEPGTGSSRNIQIDISSNGYSDIAARRTTTDSYSAQFAGAIVADLLLRILNATGASENITSGRIVSGAFMLTYSAVCKSLKEIFDELAEASGYKWYIDDNRALHFCDEDTVVDAAHDLIEGGGFTDYQIDGVELSLDSYRNKQFVKYANDTVLTVSNDTEIASRQSAEGAGYSSGVYGDVIDDSNIFSELDATNAAQNALKRYGSMPYELRFTSCTTDWAAGTKLTVNLPTFGINQDTAYLIESVSLRDSDGLNMVASVAASRRSESNFSTQRSEGYKEYFAKLSTKTGGGGTVASPFDLESLDIYSDGFSAKYSGESVSYTWTKDGDGKITKLTTEDNVEIPVTWHAGGM